METVQAVLAGIALVVLLSPLIMLLLTFFVLVPLALLAPPLSTIGRATFDCPLSKRRVHAAFANAAGSAKPNDVLECSAFPDPGDVRCKKECLNGAETHWTPSPMTPRYALLADGAAYRDAA